MSETAAATGAAHDVTAVTGPPLPGGMDLAVALKEATIADSTVARLRRKLDKARATADTIVADTQAALDAAEADAEAADARVAELAGEDGGSAALAELKEAAARALADYESAAERLGGGE